MYIIRVPKGEKRGRTKIFFEKIMADIFLKLLRISICPQIKDSQQTPSTRKIKKITQRHKTDCFKSVIKKKILSKPEDKTLGTIILSETM